MLEATKQPHRCGGLAILLVFCLLAPASGQVEYQLSDPIEGLGGDDLELVSRLEASANSYDAWDEEYSVCDHHGCDAAYCGGHQSRIRLSEFNVYPTFSYLDTAVGNYTEFEFASHADLGWLEMENRTVLNVADLPGTIRLGAANPGDEPSTVNVRGNGFGDVLSGFFFTCKGKERKYHLGIGPVITFPTASNDILGSNQWTIGPGAHFSTEIGKLTAGFFVWQSWKFAGDNSQKRVNQLFGKPFFLYKLSEKWEVIYIPLGLSHSWEAPQGDDWTVPVGGGLRRLCHMGGQKVGFQMQAFDYVARKPSDPEWELRFTIEFLFDE